MSENQGEEYKKLYMLAQRLAYTDIDSVNFTDFLEFINDAQEVITFIEGETDFSDPDYPF